MNIVDLARQIIEMDEEIGYLRRRCAQQEEELNMWRTHINEQNRAYERGFADIIMNCLEETK